MPTTLDRDAAEYPAAEARAMLDRMVGLIAAVGEWLAPRSDAVRMSFLVPERGGFGWYVYAKAVEFDFEMNRDLAQFGVALVKRGYPVHAALLPGSVDATVPTDGIAIHPSGGVSVYAK